jgi:hypothetical protein
VSLGANETVMGKACFEQWLWDMIYSEVKHTMAIMGFSWLRNTAMNAYRRGNLSLFLALECNIKKLKLSVLFKRLCTWLRFL